MKRAYGVILLSLLLIILGGYFIFGQNLQTLFSSKQTYQFLTSFDQEMIENDIADFSASGTSFDEVRAFFVALAEHKGAVYAFEVLKQVPLPPGIDTHLMGHAVGDELYKQVGLDGMQYCTHDFRNACSHTVVIGALLAEGDATFDKVNDVCKKAPGGPGAYTMCFHGFGHGVLAYADYELPEAIALCGRVGTDAYNREEEAQCIGGIIMEMHQGIHDPEVWAQKKDKFLDPKDPLKMCRESYMPLVAKSLCYSYITPFIFDSAGAKGGNPTPDIYPKSFTYCDEVTEDNHRRTCYGGLGKEFVVLSQDRDIRNMEDTSDEHLRTSVSWCMFAKRAEARTACVLSILDSLYWGGENDPGVSVRHCSLLKERHVQDACFEHLFGITEYYQKDPTVRRRICELVPETYADTCLRKLTTP
jgi:hypothetical protein